MVKKTKAQPREYTRVNEKELRAHSKANVLALREQIGLAPMKLGIGAFVSLATVLGFLISSGIVNRHFPSGVQKQNSSSVNANAPEQESGSLSEDPEPRSRAARFCVTLDGMRFAWPWANAPFGAQSCSQ